MTQDVPTTSGGSTRRFPGEAEWRVLMADFERWDGPPGSRSSVVHEVLPSGTALTG